MKNKKICLMLTAVIVFNSLQVTNLKANTSKEIIDDVNLQIDEEICEIDHIHDDLFYDDVNLPSVLRSTKNTKYNIDLDTYIVEQEVINETIVLSAYDDNQNLRKVGTNRGDYQIREVIPFFIKAGETITLRQLEGTGQVNFTADLKSGLKSTEVSATVNKNGNDAYLTALDDSVVYIKLPRSSFTDVTIEYSITSATTMPIYSHNVTDTQTFFEEWDYLDTKFAILETDIITLQIPKLNKEYLRDISNKGSFNDIDHVLKYYQEMIDFFDYSYGLDNSTNYNFNPKQKYLAVPELRDTGVVGTYSSDIVRAFGSSRGMLKMLDDSWLAKHEIAHGYQGDMMDYDVKVREIWNNIPSHYYSMVTNSNTDQYYKNYTTKSKPSNQMAIYNKSVSYRANGNSASYDLNFFREIFDQFGLEVFIQFNKEYRRLGQTGEHNKISNSNQFARLFSRYAEVDLVPYFLSFNGKISSEVMEETSTLPRAYYLTELVDSKTMKEYIIDRYNLVTEYSLVDTSIFYNDENLRGLTGKVIVNIDIDDFTQLDGKQIVIKNGDYFSIEEIVDGQVVFNNIPVGVYHLNMPLTNNGNYYSQSENYIIVKENATATIDGQYKESKFFHLNMLNTFDIRTDYNYTALTGTIVKSGIDNYNLIVSVISDKWNIQVGDDELYGYIAVHDSNDSLVYRYDLFNATKTTSVKNVIPIDLGYKIHLYRTRLPERKYYYNNILKNHIRDTSTELMIFEITDKGVIYKNNESYVQTEDLIKAYVGIMENQFILNKNQYSFTEERTYLQNAMLNLDENIQGSYSIHHLRNVRNNNPIISGKEEVVLNYNQNYNLLDYVEAYDYEDGDLTYKIETLDDNIDISKAGIYSASFKVIDSDYNIGKFTSKIIVQEEEAEKETTEEETREEETTEEETTEEETTEEETTEEETTEEETTEEETTEEETTEEETTEEETTEEETTEEETTKEETTEEDISAITEENKPLLSKPFIPSDDKEDDTYDFNTTINKKDVEKVEINDEASLTEKGIIENKIKYVSGGVNNSVTLEKREPYSVSVTYLELKDEYTIPFYYNNNGEKNFVKFSVPKDSKIKYLINVSNSDLIKFESNIKKFKDVEKSWSTDSINFVTAREILYGVSEENFNPKGNVSRGMLVTALGRISGETVNGYPNLFSDVDKDSWYANYVSWAKAREIVNGMDKDIFAPEIEVTREQLAVIVNNFLNKIIGYDILVSNKIEFFDHETIESWAEESVYILKSIGVLNGDDLGYFNPKNNLTREELSVVFNKLVEYVITTEEDFMVVSYGD